MRQHFEHSTTNYNPKHVDLDIRDQMMRAEYVRLLASDAAFGGWWTYDQRNQMCIRYNAIVGTLQDVQECYPLKDVRVVAEGHFSDFMFLGIDVRTKEFFQWLKNRDQILRAEADMKKAPVRGPYVFRYRVV